MRAAREDAGAPTRARRWALWALPGLIG